MRLREPLSDLSKSSRLMVLLAGGQWVLAAVLFTISLVAVHLGSTPGMTWDSSSGVIWSIVPQGPADQAGIREGDRLAAVGGVPITSALPPFYDVGPWTETDLLVERDGRLIQMPLVTMPQWELRRSGFEGGAALTIRSINEYLRIIVNAWILLLAAAILYLRPGLPQARVAAVALAYWVGGNALLEVPGFGALVASWPQWLAISTHFVDQLFFIGFLALFVNFAMIFPQPLPQVREQRWLLVVPYLFAAPVLTLSTLRMLRVFDSGMRESMPSFQLDGLMRLYSPGMFLASLAILALHFRHELLENDRRRTRWVLGSMLPPFFTWMILLSLEAIRAGNATMAVGRLLFWIGVAAGSLIFTWAIVRHRVFETKVLLRKSIQYAMARGTLLLIAAIPALALLVFLWVNRHRSLADLVTTELVGLLAILAPLGVLLQYRRGILSWIDRRFFRDQYDSHQTLAHLISMIQKGSDLTVLSRVTLMEIEKALHPKHLSFWKLDPERRGFRPLHSLGDAIASPQLPENSRVAEMMRRQAEPVQIDLLYPDQSLRRHSTSGEFWIWLSVTRAALLIPLLIDRQLRGFLLLGERRSEEPYTSVDKELMMTVARQLAITESYSRLEELARQDPLTAALNRHAYYSLIEKRGDRGEIDAGCVAVVDLDNLKVINDSMGHAAGDLAIRQVASAIRSVLRADDLVFRWGGDEFLVILFGISEELGRDRLSGVNGMIADGGFSSAMPLTVSVGVARFENAAALSSAIERADIEMYRQKADKRGTNIPASEPFSDRS